MKQFALVLYLAACGSSDSKPDAREINNTPDAPSAGTQTWGQRCSPSMPCTGDATCVTFAQGATMGVCVISCGTSPNQGEMSEPPAGGTALCEAGYTNATGTVTCALTTDTAANPIQWFCGELCGTVTQNGQTADLGTCAAGFTCVNNICN